MSLVDDEKSARGNEETKSRSVYYNRRRKAQRYTRNVKGEDCWERNVDATVEGRARGRFDSGKGEGETGIFYTKQALPGFATAHS